MAEPSDERMRIWVAWMRWLDRWGYVTVGFSFLFLGMLIFVYSWGTFALAARAAFLPAALTLVNDLLLVIILLELFRTIVRFLQTDIITLEPFLNIGIIASIRRILTAGAGTVLGATAATWLPAGQASAAASATTPSMSATLPTPSMTSRAPSP